LFVYSILYFANKSWITRYVRGSSCACVPFISAIGLRFPALLSLSLVSRGSLFPWFIHNCQINVFVVSLFNFQPTGHFAAKFQSISQQHYLGVNLLANHEWFTKWPVVGRKEPLQMEPTISFRKFLKSTAIHSVTNILAYKALRCH
jgi:hypothetical protein